MVGAVARSGPAQRARRRGLKRTDPAAHLSSLSGDDDDTNAAGAEDRLAGAPCENEHGRSAVASALPPGVQSKERVTRRHRGLEQFAVLIDSGHEAACGRPKVLTRDAFGVGERRAERV